MHTHESTSTLTALELQLREFIGRELTTDPVGADDDLIKQGIVDSLGITQLVDFCESRYGIRVTDDDLVPENFRTVRRLAEYVERRRGGPC